MEVCCNSKRLLGDRSYRERYQATEPDEALVAKLRACQEPMTLLVIMGYWCPDSLRIVPGTVRAYDEADNDNLEILGVAIPYEDTEQIPVRVGPIEVRRFPTIVFLRGTHRKVETIKTGDEIVRFVEEPVDAARVPTA